MLRRILRSRTARDVVDVLLVFGFTSLLLFAGTALTAQWMVRQWTMSAQIGASAVALYLLFAIPVSAGIATPRLYRIVRGLRGR